MCSFSSGVLENIDSELAELQRLREAATKKKERDRIGSRRCSVISFLLCHFIVNSCSDQLKLGKVCNRRGNMSQSSFESRI